MKKIVWDYQKAKRLSENTTRGGVSFEDCIVAIEEKRVLADIANPSPQYAHRIKAMALREGIPYQTLINSLLHKAISR